MSCLENITDMYDLMGQSQMMDAFEKYYAESVVMTEASGARLEDKDENRKRLTEPWLDRIDTYNGGGSHALTSNEEAGVTMAESWVDVTFKDGNHLKMEEVAVQKWNGDKIVEEWF